MKRNLLPETYHNHVEFLTEGEFFYIRFLEMIDAAGQSVHLQTYIFELDAFGTKVKTALLAAAARGVKVYLLIDSVGSTGFSKEAEAEMLHAGIYFCRFNGIRFKWFGQWGRRLHHKVLLVDHKRAIVGGINVTSGSYGQKDVVPQLDFAVSMEGQVINGLADYCENLFRAASSLAVEFERPANTLTAQLHRTKVKISINDWILRRLQITRRYSNLVKTANKNIVIINSYFFPRKKFMAQLRAASERGVRVRLILPRYSDWPSYVLATQYLYAYFFKHGIEIYEWKKSILHGKLATIDNSSSTIGSFNLNYTSYQQNLEMNVDISSSDFTEELNRKIDNWIEHSCEKIEEKDFTADTTLRKRVSRLFFYLVLSVVAGFSIGITFRHYRWPR